MPRATNLARTTSSSLDIKPYRRPSPTQNEQAEADAIAPTPDANIPRKALNTKTKASPASRAWTPDELLTLFEHVVKHGANGKKVWEGAVEGRSSNQSYQAWLNTLAPYLRKAILTKAFKGQSGRVASRSD